MNISGTGGTYYCSFCGRNQDEAGGMIVSSSANICEICVDGCNIIKRRPEKLEEEWIRLKDYAP